MTKLLLAVIGVCLGSTILFGQGPPHRGGHHHKHHPKLSKEAKAALHKFEKETVYPVKKAAHDQFLAGLNPEDQAFLEQKRGEKEALKSKMQLLRKEMRQKKESGISREAMKAERKALFKPVRDEMKALMESMKPFMERNQALLKSSTSEMHAKRETWRGQKKTILDQYLSDEQKAKMEAHRKERGERREDGKRGREHAEGRKIRGAVRFVLWDGEMKERRHCKGKACKTTDSKNNSEESSSLQNISQITAFKVSNYPNPALTQTTILLELQDVAKKVKITMTNAQGKQVWSKQYNKLNAGEHKVDVNLHKFTNGQYFYTVEIGEEQITKTLIVNQ